MWEAGCFCLMGPVFTDHRLCLRASLPLLPRNVLTVLECTGVESGTDPPLSSAPGILLTFWCWVGFSLFLFLMVTSLPLRRHM